MFGQVLALLMFAVGCGFLLLGFPVAFTLAGVALWFAALGGVLGIFDWPLLGALSSRTLGVMLNELLVAVPLFVFMGVMLERARIAERMLVNIGALFGELRGGLGISVILVGAVLAASTGIVGATVVAMGLLSLPAMLRVGYAPSLSCGIICASGTLGQIIPPSIVLVLLGDIMQGAHTQAQLRLGNYAPDPVSVLDLFAGALIPGIILVGLYIAWVAIQAVLHPESCPPVRGGMAGDYVAATTWGRLAAFVPACGLVVLVLGSILLGVATPTEAAAMGSVGSIILAGLSLGLSKRLFFAAPLAAVVLVVIAQGFDLRVGRLETLGSWLGLVVAIFAVAVILFTLGRALHKLYHSRILTEVTQMTLRISCMVFTILLGASVFSLVFRGLGGTDLVDAILLRIPGGPFGAMLAVMLLMFILGFFLDFIEIIFVVVPVVGPSLLALGLDPVWLGVMIAINLQTSYLTPPFGFALFYLAGVASDRVRTIDIYRGVIPFVLLQLFVLCLVAWWPQLATWLPRKIF